MIHYQPKGLYFVQYRFALKFAEHEKDPVKKQELLKAADEAFKLWEETGNF